MEVEAGQRNRRRVHDAREADIGEGRLDDFADRAQLGLRRLFLARPIQGNAGRPTPLPTIWRSEMREVMWISPDQSHRRGPLVLGRVSGVRLRCENAARLRRSDADRRRSIRAQDRLAGQPRPLDRRQSARTGRRCGSGLRLGRDGEAHCLSHASRNRGGSGCRRRCGARQARYRLPPLGAAKRDRGLRSHRLYQGDAGIGSGPSGQRNASQGLSAVRGDRPISAARTASRTPPTMSSSVPSTSLGRWKSFTPSTATTTRSSSAL